MSDSSCGRCPKALIVLATALFSSCGAMVGGVQPWPELGVSAGSAFRAKSEVVVRIDGDVPGQVRVPRLNNTIREVVLRTNDGESPLKLRPKPTEWIVPIPSETKAPFEVVLRLDESPYLAVEPHVAAQEADGVVSLHAHHAVVHGEKLCFEPQPHKNTIGYWVNPADWAEWHLSIAEPGEFDVVLWQGCGRGQGGSDVRLSIGDQSLDFVVEDTGHFQNFERRVVGRVRLSEAGPRVLEIRPQRLAKNAVMDVRLIELVPFASDR